MLTFVVPLAKIETFALRAWNVNISWTKNRAGSLYCCDVVCWVQGQSHRTRTLDYCRQQQQTTNVCYGIKSNYSDTLSPYILVLKFEQSILLFVNVCVCKQCGL